MSKSSLSPVEEIALNQAATKKTKKPKASPPVWCVPNIKRAAIDLWIEDLLDRTMGIAFNADISHARINKKKIAGDAALFLAARYAPVEVQDYNDLLLWLDEVDGNLHRNKCRYSTSAVLINKYTRIPLDAAEALVTPNVLIRHPDFELSAIKSRHFVKTLRNYLITGTVSWDWLLSPNAAE